MNLFYLLAAASGSSNSTTTQATNQGGFGWQTWVIYAILIVALIVMFVMSSRRRKKQQEELQQKYNSLAVGDTIKTIGMICGTIVEMCEDGTIVLLTGSETYPSYIRIDRQAIYQFSKKQEQVDPFDNLGGSSENADSQAEGETATRETSTENTEGTESTENTENTEN